MVNMSAKFDKAAHNGLVSIVFTSLLPYMHIVTLTFDLWPPKSLGDHLIMVNMSAKFNEEVHNGFSLYHVHKLISINVNCDLDLWPVTSKINRVHPLTMANMSAKFDEKAHNGLVSIMFTSLLSYMSIVTLSFTLWPPKSIGSIISLWLKCMPNFIKKHTMV